MKTWAIVFLLSALLLIAASCSRNAPAPAAPAANTHSDSAAQHDDPVHAGHREHGSADHEHHGHLASEKGHGDLHRYVEPSHANLPMHQAKDHTPSFATSEPTIERREDEGIPALAVFEKRILPIFQSVKPSSCSECHLSGVDLKDYIRPTQQETFASLVAADMIDTRNPDNSKILRFISRSPDQPSLVTEKVRQQEFEAFRAWIRAAVNDPKLLAKNDKAEPVGPKLPDEVIRHARKDRVLASFLENVWTEVGRCAACHSPDRNQEQVKKHGEQVSWIKLRNPQGTLDYMLEADLIDTEAPEKSLLLLKPTMQVEHGGGQKMGVGDRTYKQFRRFLDDYAAVVQGKYAKPNQLPKPSGELSVATEIWLKIEGVSAKYDKMLLQADLYRWTGSGWSEDRVATSDRPVFGKGNLWQHSLSLTAPRDSEWAEQIAAEKLPAGRYLVKLYIDQTGKLERDFTAELGREEFVGEVEVESRWPAGYGQMTVVKFPAK
jgi:mono/diheme cytochrome c family protein